MTPLDCRKCGAPIEDAAGTGRCRFCATAYRADAAAVGYPSVAAGHAVVEVSDVGANKIAVVKAIVTVLGLGLKDAKDTADQRCPFHLSVPRAGGKAEHLVGELTRAGARARLVG